MVKHFDHVTVVVLDVENAKWFFGLLGFKEEKSVVISGGKFGAYMAVHDIEAEHVTLVLENSHPRQEVQLLKYHHPDPIVDPHITNLAKTGYNHMCFAVDDIEAEVERLTANGVKARNEIMEFNNRKLIYLYGPEGITVELAQWL
jgi:catechol 2,3-dioxygenase-like lactoylglutathione lyase family enzyme